MSQFFSVLSKNQSLIYKGFLFVIATILVIYLMPKGGQFKYHFQKGKPWQYENLYAPFTFTIKKGEEAIADEEAAIRENSVPYFEYDKEVITESRARFSELLEETFVDSIYTTSASQARQAG